jgi:hypothetical protein
MNDVVIDECPKFLSANPTDESHSIYLPKDDLRISLELRGVTQYFPTRTPTQEEYDNCPDYLIHDLTSFTPDWNPHSLSFAQQEENMTDQFGLLREPRTRRYTRDIATIRVENHVNENSLNRARQHGSYNSQCSSVLSDISNTLNDDEFAKALRESVNVPYSSNLEDRKMSSAATGNRKSVITPEILAHTWDIGVETAKRTLRVTTQKGIKAKSNNNLTRRYRTNDRWYRYGRLHTTLYTDTLFSNTTSIIQ